MSQEEVGCDLLICLNNDHGICMSYSCELDEDDPYYVSPNTDDCLDYHLRQGEYKVLDEEEAKWFTQNIADCAIPYGILNKRSLYFTTVTLRDGRQGIVKGSLEDLKGFRFYSHVNGGIGFTDINQIELPI
jgi:hypothetical protein